MRRLKLITEYIILLKTLLCCVSFYELYHVIFVRVLSAYVMLYYKHTENRFLDI